MSANKCSIVKILTSGVYGHEKCPVNTGHVSEVNSGRLIAIRHVGGLDITVNCSV